MPRKPDAVPVARMDCMECGARIPVYQARNHFFYTRCQTCGCDQSQADAFQVAVWQRMEPIEGATDAKGVPLLIHRPRNVPESAGPLGGALSGTAPAVTVVEPAEPAAVPAPEPVQERAEKAAAPVPEKPEKPAEKPGAEPVPVPAAKPVHVPAPEPKGAGTAKGGGGGFWALMLVAASLAGGAVWLVQKSNEEVEQA